MNILYIGFPAQGHTNGTIGLLKKLNINNKVTCVTNSYYSKDYISNNLNYVILNFLDSKIDIKLFTKDYFLGFNFLINNLERAINELEEKINPIEYDLVIHDSLAIYGAVFAKKHKIATCSSITNYAFFKENINYKFILRDFLKNQFKRSIKVLSIQKKYFSLAKKYHFNNYNLINMLLLEEDLNFIFFPSEFYGDNNKENIIYLNNNLRYLEENLSSHQDRDTIFISLGTVLSNDNLLKSLFHLFNNTNHKVILLTQNHNLTKEFESYNSPNIEVLTSCNQLEILKKCKIAIYQGGTNTTNECLVNGIYHILFPQQIEQEHTSYKIKKLGIGRLFNENKLDNLIYFIENLDYNKDVMKKLDEMKKLSNAEINVSEIEERLKLYINSKK